MNAPLPDTIEMRIARILSEAAMIAVGRPIYSEKLYAEILVMARAIIGRVRGNRNATWFVSTADKLLMLESAYRQALVMIDYAKPKTTFEVLMAAAEEPLPTFCNQLDRLAAREQEVE